MDFEESNKELEKAPYDEESFEEPMAEDMGEDFGGEDIYSEKKANKRNLEIRRTIEARLDEKKMKELHDYFWDEDFVDEEDKK